MQDLNLGGNMNVSKKLEHDKCQEILKTDRSFMFCSMFSLDKYALF